MDNRKYYSTWIAKNWQMNSNNKKKRFNIKITVYGIMVNIYWNIWSISWVIVRNWMIKYKKKSYMTPFVFQMEFFSSNNNYSPNIRMTPPIKLSLDKSFWRTKNVIFFSILQFIYQKNIFRNLIFFFVLYNTLLSK